MSEPALRFPMRRGLLAVGLLVGLAACARTVDAPPTAVVFFNAWSSELDTTAQGVIAEFAKDARGTQRQIQVRGYADQIGSAQANRVLSQLRAQVVADALVAQGIAASRIVQVARGATATDPGIESRRVDLQFGPAT